MLWNIAKNLLALMLIGFFGLVCLILFGNFFMAS